MKIRPLLIPFAIALTFAATVAWLVLVDPPAVPDPAPTPQKTTKRVTEVANLSPPVFQPEPGQDVSRSSETLPPEGIRDVSPEGVSAPQVTGPLTRIDPSKRYQELLNPPVEPIPDGPMELLRVEVLDGGHLKAGRLTIKLAHIEPLSLDATCKTQLGASWPCGTRARTFLRGLIRRLKVTCSKVEELADRKISAECKRGTIDLSSRLVQFGWATADESAPEEFQELSNTAKLNEVGQWQTDWLTDLPETDWAGQSALEQLELEALAPDVVDWSLRTDPDDPTDFLNDPPLQNDLLTDIIPQQ